MPTSPTAPSAVPDFPAIGDASYNTKAYNWATHMDATYPAEMQALATSAYDNAVEAAASAAAAAAKELLTDADATATAADRVQTGLDRTAAAASAASAAAIAGAFVGTSTSSIAIGTGSKTFTTQTGELYTAGVFLSAVSAANSANFMFGQVTSYNSGTGALVLDAQVIGGSGTFADWNLSLTGARGATGPAGTLGGTASSTVDLLTGANIASAATVNLDSATGNRVHITGTTTITAVTLTRGPRTVIFDGILTLTHHATNNNLPGAANITTAAGDRAIYESDGTTVYCASYIRASGLPVVAGSSGALTLLATLTPTAAANLDFLSTFSSTYDNYLIIGNGIKPATDDFLQIRFANAGSADNGSNYYKKLAESSSEITAATTSVSVASVIYAAGKGVDFVLTVINANDAINLKFVSGKWGSQQSATPGYGMNGMHGVYPPANAVSGFRLYWDSGSNFSATGKVRVYGYANS